MLKNNKIYFLFITLSSIVLFSCSSIPSELNEYLSQMSFSKAYEYATSARLTTSFEQYEDSNTKWGKKEIIEEFKKDDSSDDLIANGISRSEILIYNNLSLGYVKYTKSNDTSSSNKTIAKSETIQTIKNIFYDESLSTAYIYGGIYYGDYFRAKESYFYPYYEISDDQSSLTLNYVDDGLTISGVKMELIQTINNYGLLSYDSEIGYLKTNDFLAAKQEINVDYNIEIEELHQL